MLVDGFTRFWMICTRVSLSLSPTLFFPISLILLFETAPLSCAFRKPDIATFTSDRVSIPQAFSNSFQGVQYRNQGLSTALSKSSYHAKLDPSFG